MMKKPLQLCTKQKIPCIPVQNKGILKLSTRTFKPLLNLKCKASLLLYNNFVLLVQSYETNRNQISQQILPLGIRE